MGNGRGGDSMKPPSDWKMYKHRNGESEPPSVEGAYIFVGEFVLPYEFAYLFSYYPFPGDRQDTVTYLDDEAEIPFSELANGKWYGPVATEHKLVTA